MKLWSYWRSSCAYRVRIALGLKQLPFEYSAVHLLREGGQQHQAEFGALNPQRQVPVLEIDDGGRTVRPRAVDGHHRVPRRALSGAAAACPSSLADRAHVRALAELVNSGIQPLQNTGDLALS